MPYSDRPASAASSRPRRDPGASTRCWHPSAASSAATTPPTSPTGGGGFQARAARLRRWHAHSPGPSWREPCLTAAASLALRAAAALATNTDSFGGGFQARAAASAPLGRPPPHPYPRPLSAFAAAAALASSACALQPLWPRHQLAFTRAPRHRFGPRGLRDGRGGKTHQLLCSGECRPARILVLFASCGCVLWKNVCGFDQMIGVSRRIDDYSCVISHQRITFVENLCTVIVATAQRLAPRPADAAAPVPAPGDMRASWFNRCGLTPQLLFQVHTTRKHRLLLVDMESRTACSLSLVVSSTLNVLFRMASSIPHEPDTQQQQGHQPQGPKHRPTRSCANRQRRPPSCPCPHQARDVHC